MSKTIDNIIYSDDLKTVEKAENKQITTAVIKKGVTTIGEWAFSYCKNLQSVDIPDSVTEIGRYAFKYCKIENYEHKIFKVKNGCFLSSDGKTLLYCANDSKQEVVIPEGVTTIGVWAFSYCENLQSVVIPEGVTTFEARAFYECTNLQNVVIPSSVTTIGGGAFSGCENLQNVAISEGVTTIGESAFSGCKKLQNVVILEGVTEIGDSAFSYCENLQSVDIPDSVTEIGRYAFKSCKIENYEHKLFKVKNGCCLSSDGKTVLYCANVSKEEIVIPESVTTIKSSAFWGCKNLQNVTIPESVTSIGDEAFYGCKNLKEVHFGGNIEKLTGQIFDGCPDVELYAPEKSLTEKAIKKNAKLKKLYKKAEYELKQAKNAKITEIKAVGTEGLLRVYSEGIGKEQKIGQVEKNIEVMILTNELSSENKSKYAKITVPEKTVQKKLSEIQTAFDEVRSEGENVTVEKLLETLKKNVESFEWEIYNEEDDRTIYLVKVLKCKKNPFFHTFYSVYKKFTNVIISKKVKEIKEHSFYNCTNLQSINITDLSAWIEIDNNGNPLKNENVKLYLNGKLVDFTNFVIPSGTKKIGEWAFYKCSNLQSVVIPEGVTSIGKSAFSHCENLQNVAIPEGVTTIGEYAFCECTNLQNVAIPEGVTTIGEYAFCECTNLQNVVIPEGVTTIGEFAFCECTNLQSVTILEGVTSIGKGAFLRCKNLQSVVIPEGVTSIGKEAFEDCTNLQSVIIPSSVTTIGEGAFWGCKNLQSVIIPSSVTTIGEYAFDYCTNLQSVVIPEGVTTIGGYAFKDCTKLTVTFDGTKEEWEKIEGVKDCEAGNVKFTK